MFGKYSKFIVAIASGVVIFLNTAYGSNTPWVTEVVAVLGALGVFAVPNAA